MSFHKVPVLIVFLILLLALVVPVSAQTTVTIYADKDGYVGEGTPDAIFPTLRNAAGDIVSNSEAQSLFSGYSLAATTSGIFSANDRGGFSFPTSSLPDGVTIISCNASFAMSAKYNSAGEYALELVDFFPADSSAFAVGDYDATTFTRLAPNISYASVTSAVTDGYNTFVLNNFTTINKTGNTTLMTINAADFYNVNLSELWVSGGATGYKIASILRSSGIYRPYLTITYETEGFSNLQNTSYARAINFTWDAGNDVNTTMVYKDGVFFHNVSEPTQYDYWRNLDPDTEYIFSSRYVNDTGGLNETWNNLTVSTSSLKTWPKVMIHFDNGYRTVATNAYPILSPYGYNGTVYLTESMVTNSAYLDVANLTTLYNAGWDIANHGYIHNHFTDEMTIDQVKENVTLGQEWLLANGFPRAMYHLAFPTGLHNDAVITAVSEVGTLTARTVENADLVIPYAGLPEIPLGMYVVNTTAPSEIITNLESAATINNTFSILFHEIQETTTDYNAYTPANFQTFVNATYDRGYEAITISEWYTLNEIAPVASFTTNVTSGTVPLAVGFTDTSTNTPTDWDWYINDVKFSDLQNPEYTFTEAGVYDVSLYAANGASGDWENKTDYITVTNWYDLQCENQTGNITLALFFNSTTSLGWQWSDPVNITQIAEDGLFVTNFDNSSGSFIGTGYLPESWHRLRIYNETDFGQLNCTTDALPITPTPIPIMPSTESNVNPANLFQYWPYALLALGLVVVFKKW